MSKTTTVWKVVNLRRRSVIIKGQMAVSYRKGITTRPKDSRFPLFAFRTRLAAELFKRCGYDGRVLKCIAVLSTRKHPLVTNMSWNFRRIWTVKMMLVEFKRRRKLKNRIGFIKTGFTMDTPRGTVFCRSITPLE